VTLDMDDLEKRRAMSRPPTNAKLLATPQSAAQLQQLQDASRLAFEANGLIQPPPAASDSLNRYRVRLLHTLQQASPTYRNAEIWTSTANDPKRLDTLESKIADEAMQAAHSSSTLNPVLFEDRTGRRGLEFFGKKSAWMSEFKQVPQLMIEINGEPVDWL
jgi:hypothetical protein